MRYRVLFLFSFVIQLFFSEVCGVSNLGCNGLITTEGDPDSFLEHLVNVISGDYCEVVTDVVIKGPDDLVLQRYYSNSNYVTGQGSGGWRLLPQCWLITGKDPRGESCTIGQTSYDWVYAFNGERTGSILTYSGWESRTSDDEGLQVWAFRDGKEACNTARGEGSGKSNIQNGKLLYLTDQKGYRLTTGDGTRRYFEGVESIPNDSFGVGLYGDLAGRVVDPEYYRLTKEELPSGNIIIYRYDEEGCVRRMEILSSVGKILSWIEFSYLEDLVTVSSSDDRRVFYEFDDGLLYHFPEITS